MGRTVTGRARERLALVVVLTLVVLASWAWVVELASDMSGSGHGSAAWMMTNTWDTPHLILLWLMWAVMMVGMMLPSASPMIWIYSRASPARSGTTSVLTPAMGLALGYLLVWGIFSVGATALQRVLAEAALLSPGMAPANPALIPVLLFAAGTYQLTPLKRACLHNCQSPLSALMRWWKPGWAGALRMGFRQGLYCLGCCWVLMLLLFAGGVMNLAVIGLLTAWVIIEKLAPGGALVSNIGGAMLIAAGAWYLLVLV